MTARRRRTPVLADEHDPLDPLDAVHGSNERQRATNAVLACGARCVRLTMRDGRVLVGTCPGYDGGAWFRFQAFGETRARRIHREHVQLADVAGFERHADLVAVARAQRAGDFTARTLARFRNTYAGGTP